MTLSESSQLKSELNGRILSKLKEINDLTGLKKFQIGEKLGVKKSTIYRGASGKGGSFQLLAGLELLLRDIKNQKRIEELEQALRTVNTVNPSNYQLNEEPPLKPTQKINYGKSEKALKAVRDLAKKPAPAK